MARSSSAPGGPTTSPSPKGARRSQKRARRQDLKPNGKPRTIFWRMRRVFFVFVLLFVTAVGAAGYAFTQVPLPDEDPPLLQTSFFCAADVTFDCNRDNSIAQLSGSEDRVNVTYDQIPTVLVQAVLAAEDRTYYDHGGVDPAGIVRALWANFRAEDVRQGGSTITQQYVKNVYLTQERTVTRKIKEAALAVKLERELTKQEILTRYLNTIYFGRGAYGVEAASRTYFGAPLAEITLPEAAYLAGLIRSPETADAQLAPDDPKFQSNRSTAEFRRNSVLQAMVETGDITQADHDAAAASGWDSVLPRNPNPNSIRVADPGSGSEYYVEYVRHWLTLPKDQGGGGFTDAEVYGGGLRVYTTLDVQDQQDAFDAVTSTLDREGDPDAALVSIDDVGAVRAMVGGRGYSSGEDWARVNLATGTEGGGSGRQPGSSFKAFTLVAAMEQGIPLTKAYNAPSKIVIPKANNGADYEVRNYDAQALGTLDLVTATAKSSNTAYVQLAKDVGPENIVDVAHRMGVTAPLDPGLSLTLGGSAVSVLDMASGYSTLADGGEHVPPFAVSKVTDAQGDVLYEHRSTRERVLDEKVVGSVNYALSQVVQTGTGTGAKIPGQSVAGKTGTADEYTNAWFAGFTCKLTTAVWVGFVPPALSGGNIPMTNVHGIKVTGGSLPTTIWQRDMAKATEGLDSCEYPRPAGAPSVTTNTAPPATTSTTTPTDSTTTAPSTTAPATPTTVAPAVNQPAAVGDDR